MSLFTRYTLTLTSLVSILGAVAASVYTLDATVAFNLVDLPGERPTQLRIVTPQGWAFFTRDPREPVLTMFGLREDSWRPLEIGPNTRITHAFGWSRAPRRQGLESGLLVTKIPDEIWSECRRQPAQCLDDLDVGLELDNLSPTPTLCGVVGFVMQPPAPFAWVADRPRSMAERVVMPSKVVKVGVKCAS